MKMTTTSGLLITFFILASLVACGGSSSSSAPVQPTKAVITLFSTATGALPAGTLIYTTQATINLPAGVTVKASPSSANPQVMVVNTPVLAASGVAAGAETVIAPYLASSTTPTTYKVELYMAKSNGFPAGEFAVLNCDITAGHAPAAADFTVTDFKTFDSNGLSIPGFTVGFTATIQ